jgi:outer membrane protein assembly factor BamA
MAVITAVVIVAVGALGLGAAAPASGQPVALGWPPTILFEDTAANDPVLRAHAATDRSWLGSQPAFLLTAPPQDADLPTLVDWMRRVERAQPRPAAPGTDAAAFTPHDEATAPLTGRRDLLAGLRDRWLARGHLAARVRLAPDDTLGPGPVIVVAPGPRHTLTSVTVEGEDFPGRARLLELWLPQPGDPFAPDVYLTAAAGIVAGCAEQGHPFPIWLTRSLEIDPVAATVAIAAVLVPGPVAVIGPQRTTLAAGRGEDFLVRAAGLRTGRPYRESDLRRARDRLFARDLYARVDEPVVHLTTSPDTVGILWRVEPLQRPNRTAVILGLSRREEGGTRLSGQVELELPNLAGTGRRLSAGWRDDGVQRSRFGFRYLEPLVAGTPLDGEVSLESEVQEDAYTRFTVENRWRLPVASLWGVELGVAWDRTTFPLGTLESSRRWRWRAGLLRARGDRTRSGWSAALAVETVRRGLSERAPDDDGGPVQPPAQLGRQDQQRLVEVDLGGELWLGPELSLAGRASYRRNQADQRPVPLPELYRFGGAVSLRGYREDEFGGETAAWGALEVRLGRALRSRVYTFVDVGYVEWTVREAAALGGGLVGYDDTLTGFGLGLLTVAAAGQINLAIGFPGNFDFETAKLHVSLLGGF